MIIIQSAGLFSGMFEQALVKDVVITSQKAYIFLAT